MVICLTILFLVVFLILCCASGIDKRNSELELREARLRARVQMLEQIHKQVWILKNSVYVLMTIKTQTPNPALFQNFCQNVSLGRAVAGRTVSGRVGFFTEHHFGFWHLKLSVTFFLIWFAKKICQIVVIQLTLKRLKNLPKKSSNHQCDKISRRKQT